MRLAHTTTTTTTYHHLTPAEPPLLLTTTTTTNNNKHDTQTPLPPPSLHRRAPQTEPKHSIIPNTQPRYGAEQGVNTLREALAKAFYPNGMRSADEVFVSDGSKCDIGRLQMMFGSGISVAVQDPAYPVYVDTTVMMGNTGGHNGTNFDKIEYMPCMPNNNFFPDLSKVRQTAVLRVRVSP